jgi:hypothetical protein
VSDQIRIEWYGFFDDPHQTTPVHDPGDSAPWTDDTVRTISLMPETRTGSYFYRVHRACHDQWMAEHGNENEPPSEWLMGVLTP